MKTMKFNETSIPTSYSVDSEAKLNLMIAETHVENMYKCVFTAIAKFLSVNKHVADDAKIAIEVRDTKNNFKAAAIVQHTDGGDESEDSGNFNFVFTFNEEDVADVDAANKFSIFDPAFVTLMGQIALTEFKFSFVNPNFINGAVNLVFDNLIKFLDMNTGDEGIEVELDGYFVAVGEMEDGIKVFGIVPGEHIKTIIKDDAALS